MGILLACDAQANEDDLLEQDEMDYVVQEAHKIALRISKRQPLYHFSKIVKRYYGFETPPKK